ncbi:potassium channel subfamily K member 16-like [Lacerta agilis]|uniref:potassium channel subfamily K member 16-like n=1 Tax=Lacerta agilis TaxID=80427 RepID=UPI001419C801|nr:potassium channel subfamily K member 16-like [Lacerta agilis]
MHISSLQGTLLLIGFLSYLVMGAFVFELLEDDHHRSREQATYHMKEQFFLNYTSLSKEEVERFIVKLVKAVRSGIVPIGHLPPEKYSSWDFAHSFFFVGTILSTIGYGNVCPQTAEGQIFCVVFALLGIPFNLICLNYIGFLVSSTCERCAEKLFANDKKKSTKYISLFVVMGILVFLVLPAFFFQSMEGWNYSEAIYYAFITLSTIGFGDYLIGMNHDRTYFGGYMLLAAIWISIGLAWITVLFELVSLFLAPVEPSASLPKDSRG